MFPIAVFVMEFSTGNTSGSRTTLVCLYPWARNISVEVKAHRNANGVNVRFNAILTGFQKQGHIYAGRSDKISGTNHTIAIQLSRHTSRLIDQEDLFHIIMQGVKHKANTIRSTFAEATLKYVRFTLSCTSVIGYIIAIIRDPDEEIWQS